MIDIITLTYENQIELLRTLKSFEQCVNNIENIIVIYDGMRPLFPKGEISIAVIKKVRLIEGPGRGIYPAMNYALRYIQNDFIFVNSGDLLVGNPFNEVKGMNVPLSFSCMGRFNADAIKPIRPNKNLLKFNHNSIIFPKQFKQTYHEQYKIAADLDIILRLAHEYDFPTYIKTKAYLLYDLNGVSSKHKATRDFEYFTITRHHNKLFLSIFYYIKYLSAKLRGYE